MGAIYRREVSAYFTSAIAYVFFAAFFLTTGFFFSVSSIASATTDMSGTFSSIFMILLVLIPLLTMKLFSDEKRQKTEQCLLTAPIRLGEMVLGKYLAALSLYGIAVCIFFVYGLVIQFFGNVQWTYVISNIFALFLLGAAFIAVGTFFSALTESQIVAAVLSFFGLLFLTLIDTVANYVSKYKVLADLLVSLSVYNKYSEFTSGLFNLSNVLFMLSLILIFNFLTVRIYEKRRWA
jgi:ABC-2 type transport system permease protein